MTIINLAVTKVTKTTGTAAITEETALVCFKNEVSCYRGTGSIDGDDSNDATANGEKTYESCYNQLTVCCSAAIMVWQELLL